MNVLMITGDKNLFTESSSAHKRLLLQRGAVEQLDAVYWGKGSLTNAVMVGEHHDVVTVQDPLWRGLVGLYVAKRIKAKLNVQVHMDLETLPFFKHVLAQIVLRHADSIRVVTEKVGAQVERIGVKAEITVLPMFVDLQKFKSLSGREHVGKNILWIGRFEEEKNPLAAIAIFKEVLKSIPDAKLTMLGSGSMSSQIKDHAANLPIEMPGWLDTAHYLDSADVVLCTSHYESWGASIIEALAAGVPVVSPDVGVAKEAGAIIVDSRDKLANKVIEVLQSGERGVLKLNFLPADEWALAWRNSLI